MLDRADPVVKALHVVAGNHGDRLLEEDRPAIERRIDEMDVQPVTFTPWARASATAWAPGNAGRSEGWALRIRPGNAPSTAGPTIRM